MTDRERNSIEKKSRLNHHPAGKTTENKKQTAKQSAGLHEILQKLGNRTVQRLLLQRQGDAPYTLDDETAGQIARERGNGAPLDSKLQMQMSDQLGFDLRSVRVHTSSAADALNQQINAKAFTTGQDVFFRSGAYNPQSTSGKELIAHELTHVVQQGSGEVQNQGGMTVNAPGDRFEQEADNVSKEVTQGSQPSVVQSHEDDLQMQEEEELQLQEEEEVQMNGTEEEEEMVQAKY